jgi:CTP:molybdopterin cytidylyltransferase MocA
LEKWQSVFDLKAGMDELDAEIEVAMIFLCDPFISAAPDPVSVRKHGQGSQASIIAPGVHGKPSKSVLFKNDTFQAFSLLKGEEGEKSYSINLHGN